MRTLGSRGVGAPNVAWVVALVAALGVSSLACGGGKPPKNVNDEDHSPPSTDEAAPKWDTSSETADGARHPDFNSNAPSDAPAAPQSAPPKQRRADEYDKEGTEVALKRAARQVKTNCGAAKDEDGKAKGPWGKVTINVGLGHNGHSKEITVPAPYDGQPVGRCIVQAFTNLTFPPWGGADTSVTWDVELVQPK